MGDEPDVRRNATAPRGGENGNHPFVQTFHQQLRWSRRARDDGEVQLLPSLNHLELGDSLDLEQRREDRRMQLYHGAVDGGQFEDVVVATIDRLEPTERQIAGAWFAPKSGHVAQPVTDERLGAVVKVGGEHMVAPLPIWYRLLESLTPSERRVAYLAAGGKTNPEIAQHLYVSRKTVESHLRSIYRKLDISSREHLAGKLDARSTATLAG